jgi:hypothetical protein
LTPFLSLARQRASTVVLATRFVGLCVSVIAATRSTLAIESTQRLALQRDRVKAVPQLGRHVARLASQSVEVLDCLPQPPLETLHPRVVAVGH